MANRILRDWTQSENINKLSYKAEVFFTRLIMKADDFGCYYGNLKLIKSALYPLRSITETEIVSFINECQEVGLIICYVVDNKDYIKINNFGQRLRIMKSKFPQPNDGKVRSIVSNLPLETKRSRNEVETENETETIDFEIFWNLYNKKVGDKKKIASKWEKLKNEDRQKIIDTLPNFLNSIKDKQYQPYPETYLNNKRWLDEVETTETKKEYTLYTPLGSGKYMLTESELNDKIKNTYFKLNP